jgi:hypothetical protein
MELNSSFARLALFFLLFTVIRLRKFPCLLSSFNKTDRAIIDDKPELFYGIASICPAEAAVFPVLNRQIHHDR